MLSPEVQEQILQLKRDYSIYSPLADPKLFKTIIEELARPFKDKQINKVLGLEARGFILGAPVAYLLNAGFLVARKQGNMYPDYENKEVYTESTIDYTGKTKILEIENNLKAIRPEDKILIVDDWFETGGQGHAAIKLVEKAGAIVMGISIMLDDMNKEVRNSFSDYPVHALVVKELFQK